MSVPSPSRLRSDPFQKKRRYFHGSTPVEAGAKWLAAAALALAGVWLGTALFLRGDQTPSSPGELAHVHAVWDSDCAACHRPHPWGKTDTAWSDTNQRWRDFTCDNCHGDAAHHENAKWGLASNRQCGECHREHGGREHSLKNLPDSACTRCHADLTQHSQKAPATANEVTSFVTRHPEF